MVDAAREPVRVRVSVPCNRPHPTPGAWLYQREDFEVVGVEEPALGKIRTLVAKGLA